AIDERDDGPASGEMSPYLIRLRVPGEAVPAARFRRLDQGIGVNTLPRVENVGEVFGDDLVVAPIAEHHRERGPSTEESSLGDGRHTEHAKRRRWVHGDRVRRRIRRISRWTSP